MMKKRLFAFGLAGVMLMGMSMNAFAADATNDVSDGSGSSTVEYTQPESYVVKIPKAITISNIKDGTDIEGFAEPDINVKKGNKVAISVTTVDFTVTGKAGWNKPLNMAVYDEKGSKIAENTEVISYSLNDTDQTLETKSTSLKVKLENPPSKIYADEYDGTVQFTIAIKAKN